MRLCQLSNALMVVPAAYATYRGMRWVAAVLLLSMLLSVNYHMDETDDRALLADIAGCSAIGACGFYLLLNSDGVFTVWNVLAMVYGAAAIACFSLAGPDTGTHEYDALHAGWHVLIVYAFVAFLHGQWAGSTPGRAWPPALRPRGGRLLLGEERRRGGAQAAAGAGAAEAGEAGEADHGEVDRARRDGRADALRGDALWEGEDADALRAEPGAAAQEVAGCERRVEYAVAAKPLARLRDRRDELGLAKGGRVLLLARA
jgi:hypothetical protein